MAGRARRDPPLQRKGPPDGRARRVVQGVAVLVPLGVGLALVAALVARALRPAPKKRREPKKTW